jgi:hypothetical protein
MWTKKWALVPTHIMLYFLYLWGVGYTMGAKVAYPPPWDPYTTIPTIDNWKILSKYLAIQEMGLDSGCPNLGGIS